MSVVRLTMTIGRKSYESRQIWCKEMVTRKAWTLSIAWIPSQPWWYRVPPDILSLYSEELNTQSSWLMLMTWSPKSTEKKLKTNPPPKITPQKRKKSKDRHTWLSTKSSKTTKWTSSIPSTRRSTSMTLRRCWHGASRRITRGWLVCRNSLGAIWVPYRYRNSIKTGRKTCSETGAWKKILASVTWSKRI